MIRPSMIRQTMIGGIGKMGKTRLKCGRAKEMFSPYLDGAVTGAEMLALQQHLSDCVECDGEYQTLRKTQQV